MAEELKCACGVVIGTIKPRGEKVGIRSFKIKSNGNECKKSPTKKHYLHCFTCCEK